MTRTGQSRWLLAGLLAIVALILAAFVLAPVIPADPVTITDSVDGGTVSYSADDTSVLVDASCITVSWQVENISGVEVDHDGMVGQGTRKSCTQVPSLDVTFRDGTVKTYTIVKDVRLDSLTMRALLTVSILLLLLALIVTGVPARVLRGLRASWLGRRLDALLPKPVRERPNAQTQTAILWAMVVIVLIGAVVRGYFLPKSLRFDEVSTYMNYASQSLGDVLSDYAAPNNHIFHTVLVHLATSELGIYPWTLRLPAFFAGILVVAATFAVGKRFYDVRVGLIAAAIAAASSWLIEYSVYARGYSMITLDFLLLLLVAGALVRKQTVRRWAAFAVLSALGLATIPVMIYPLGIVCGWLVFSLLRTGTVQQMWLSLRAMIFSLIAGAVLTLLCYAPAILRILSEQQIDHRFTATQQVGWTEYWVIAATEFPNTWRRMSSDLSPIILALLVIGFFVGLLFHSRLARDRVVWLSAAVLWLPAVFFIQAAPTYERLWVYLYPLLLVTAMAGLVYLARLALRHFALPPLRVLVPAALVIAAALAVGEVRSGSIQVAGGPGSVAGTEVIYRYLRDQVTDDDNRVVCVNFCVTQDLYGIIYNIDVHHIGPSMTVPDHPFYIIMLTTKPATDLKELWKLLYWKPEQIADISIALDTGTAALYRLTPATAAAS